MDGPVFGNPEHFVRRADSGRTIETRTNRGRTQGQQVLPWEARTMERGHARHSGVWMDGLQVNHSS